MYRILIAASLLFSTLFLTAQTDTLYALGASGALIEKQVIDAKLEEMRAKFAAKDLDWSANFSISHEDRRADTLILYGRIDLVENTLLEGRDRPVALNDALPDFSLTDLEGKPISLKNFEGKVLLLNFWFTACAPCIAEMPDLNRLKEYYEEQDVVFLSMAPERAPKVEEFLEKHRFTYHHLPAAGDYIEQFGAGYPKNILVDRTGIIRYLGGAVHSTTDEETGEMSWGTLQQKLDALLAD